MYHTRAFAAVAYWKKLDHVLVQNVPALYECIEDYSKPLILTKNEFFTASMILNNVRLVPLNPEMNLPHVNAERRYSFFEQSWEEHMPNYVIGFPEIKTCTNHRMEVLSDNYDFVACKLPEFISNISVITHNVPLDEDLQKFFRALILFQRTMGANSLGIFDFYLENKMIKLCRKYVASLEEYAFYWEKTKELNLKLSENRKKHYKCFWCYQTFIGLTAQGMSKGILYDRPDHIPRAMQDLIFILPTINIPIYYISKIICTFLGNPQPQNALQAYNCAIDSIAEKIDISSPQFAIHFEQLLYQKNLELVEEAVQQFSTDFILLNGNLSQQENVNNNEEKEEGEIQVLFGAEGNIIRKVDPETKNPIAVTLKSFLPDKKNQRRYFQRRKKDSNTDRDVIRGAEREVNPETEKVDEKETKIDTINNVAVLAKSSGGIGKSLKLLVADINEK